MAFRGLMTIAKRHEPSFGPFMSLHEIGNLFNDIFGGGDVEPLKEYNAGLFSPRIDVSEGEKEIKISAEIPGMDEKDIHVTIGKDALTIKGEKKNEKEENAKGYHWIERSYGSFCRTIPLPVEVEADKIEASYKKGVLTVIIPMAAKAVEEKKKIDVKVG